MTSPFEEEGILLVLPGLHPVEDEPGGAHQMALAAVVDLALIAEGRGVFMGGGIGGSCHHLDV